MSFSTLYICYFGLREPLVQTQVLPYLREIRDGGIKVSLLTFEPEPKQNWTTEQIENERKKLSEEGIEWSFLTYHKRPSAPATAFDIICGAFWVWRLSRRQKIDLLHARIHVPAMMGAIAKKFSFRKKPKLIFDIRGFFPEEYVDAGTWQKDGWLYKVVKRVEKWLLKQSDGFVVLTEQAREIMFPESKETGFDKFERPVEVIPCCVNYQVFEENRENGRETVRKRLGFQNRFVIAYTGSLGGLYQTDKIADFFRTARERNQSTFVMILTQSNPDLIVPLLQEAGFSQDDYLITRIAPYEIPNYLNGADLGLSFVKSGYATLSRSPTKIPEYLACGLPIIANSGVGDVEQLVKEDQVGVIIEDFTPESYVRALEAIETIAQNTHSLAERCKSSAKSRFDLTLEGGTKYRRLYQRLLK